MKNKKQMEDMLARQQAPSPDPALKEKILARAATEMPAPAVQGVKRTAPLIRHKPILAIAMIALLICACSLGAAGLYFEEYESVYIDTNPSVELVLNRFERIHKVIYHNEDARKAFADVELKGLRAEDGMGAIIDALSTQGYVTEDAEICISTSSKKNANTQKLLEKMTEKAQKQAKSNGCSVNISSEKLSKQEIEQAKEQGISPAKLKRIQAIRALDPSYTEEQLAEMDINTLTKLYKELSRAQKHENGKDK